MWAELRASLRENVSGAVVWLLAAACFVTAAVAIDGFFVVGNVKITLAQVLVLAFAAAGETVVIIGGGFDVSVQGMISASAVLCAQLTNGHNGALLWVIPLVLGIAVVVGTVNGVGIVWLGVPPIMMTIATNVIIGGASALEAGFNASSQAPPALQEIVYSSVAGVPISVLTLLALTVGMVFVLGKTTYGRRLYAVGADPIVSLHSGIRPAPTRIVSYMLSATCAACAGIVLLAYLTTASLGIGDPYLFTAVAAAAVGGVSLVGGGGNYVGVLGAAVFLTLLTLILTAESAGPGVLDIIYGAAILVCVLAAARRPGAT